MITNINRTRSHALLIDVNNLEALAKFLSENYEQIGYKVECIEGTTFEFSSITEIIHYENPKFRRITSIAMKFASSDKSRGEFRIEAGLFRNYLLCLTDTDDSRALKVANEIEARLLSCKPWYSLFTRLPLPMWLMISFILLLSLLSWINVFTRGQTADSDYSFISILYLTLPFALIGILLFEYADRWWKWLFPRVFFLVGNQLGEWRKIEKTQMYIFGTVLTGLVISIVVGIIT